MIVCQYGEDIGIRETRLAQRLWLAQIRFRKRHGLEPKFRTPAYWAAWAARQALYRELHREFFSDWRIKLILKLAHGIAIQRARKKAPPYKSFRGLASIEYYEGLEAWELPKAEEADLPF
jgi:hypothetical protein